MQTYLPYPNYTMSARVLDDATLNQQRVDNLTLMWALAGGEGLKEDLEHWVTDMWRGYEPALLEYQHAVCWEWHKVRGYEDLYMAETVYALQTSMTILADIECGDVSDPWWLGDMDLHHSHKSNLIRVNPGFYTPLFPGVPDNLPYVDANRMA